MKIKVETPEWFGMTGVFIFWGNIPVSTLWSHTFLVSVVLRPAHTKIDNYNDNISVHTKCNIVLFIISERCSYNISRFKCSSSLKSSGFCLDVDVFIVHQLEKNFLKVIQTILLACVIIVKVLVWTSKFIVILVLDVNGPCLLVLSENSYYTFLKS